MSNNKISIYPGRQSNMAHNTQSQKNLNIVENTVSASEQQENTLLGDIPYEDKKAMDPEAINEYQDEPETQSRTLNVH